MTLDELPWIGGKWAYGDSDRADIYIDGMSYRFYKGRSWRVFTGGSGESRLVFEGDTAEVLLLQAFLLELVKGKTVTFE